MALAMGTRLGAYELLGLIGAGGMGEVYRARDTRLGRDVAIKVLPEAFATDAERLARFKREAQVLASLNHPHIAAIYGLEDTPNGSALILELVDGPTLLARIAQGPIPLDEALPIAKQIADALEAAHEHGLIHRDLKPANIKLTPDGTVKVLDFGLAKALDTPTGSTLSHSPTITSPVMTMGGVILGTAAYMSPEQARGKPVDKRSDIWAFGCVLYEMLTGRPAFEGATLSDLFAAILTKEPNWAAVPTAAQRVAPLIRRCLVKDSKQRLRDIGEARLALEAPSIPDRPVEHGQRGVRRVLVWAAVAVGCIAAAVAGWATYFRDPPPAQPTLRYEIPAPHNQRILSFALSPDGRWLTFATLGRGGRGDILRQLWVRRLDALEAAGVPGSEGVLAAFWSPDNRAIAFFAGGELRKADLLGGPPAKICAAPTQASGAWSREGVILFTGPEGQLHGVSAEGGETRPVTKLDVTRQEIAHQFPQFLPDGQHFLYTAISSVAANSGVYMASLQSTQTTRLVTTDTNVAYTQDASGQGYLLYGRGTSLLGQRFNAEAGTLHGEPFAVADNLAALGGSLYGNVWPQFSSSSTGSVLSYQRGGVVPKELVWLDRAGRRLNTVGEPADYSNPGLSPNERMLAVSRYDPQVRTRDIWIFDLERSVSSRLTSHGGDDTNPVWSPDNRRIAYNSTRNGPRAVYVKEVNGTSEERLLYGSRDAITTFDWSSDGRHLLITDAVFLLDGERKVIPLRDLGDPSISPDRNWVAYTSDESGRTEIYVQSFPELLAGRSTRRWPVSTSGGTSTEWRRDSQELYYLDSENQLMSVTVKGNGSALDLGAPKALFRMRVEAANRRAHYQPAANGQRFLAVQLPESESAQPVTVVVNWRGEVSR